MTERRRLERNLHDGAQQRLVALAVQLRVLEKRLGEPDKAIALLRGAATELEQALAELRELARGLHPAVLADRGLAAALETLASRSPLPLELEGVPEGRLAGAAGGRRVLRRRGEPHQRGQARRGERGARAHGHRGR